MNEMVVPDRWEIKKLEDCIETSIAGEWGSPEEGNEQDIAVLRSTNFTNSGFLDFSKIAVRNILEKKLSKKRLRKKDILLEKSGGSPKQPVGRVVWFDKEGDFSFANFLQLIRSSSGCDAKYLFYKLFFEYQNRLVMQFQQQTTGIINFQLKEYLLSKVLTPPLQEQKKIASILTSVDHVIEKTQSQINKLQDLKKATMNELLTRGIGHTEFKDSSVGRIPKEWEVKKLGDLSINGINNGVFCDPKKVGSGYRLINVYDMYQGFGVDVNKLKLLNIDEKEFSKNRVIEGDVFFTRSSLKLEGIAFCNINLSQSGDLTYDGHIMRIRPNQDVIEPEFLAYYCLSNFARTYFMRSAKHSTMTTIGQKDISPLSVVIPQKEEQEKIVSIIASVANSIKEKQRKLEQTQSLKKSLMQDLLTGKVRVTIN